MSYDPNQIHTPTMPPYGQQPQKKGMSTGGKVALGCGVPALLAVVMLGGCMALVGGAAHEVKSSVASQEAEAKRAAKEDIRLLSCKLVDDGFGKDLKARIRITNHGKKRANYLVDGEFIDQKGNKVDSLTATVDSLAPGVSSTQDFVALVTSDQLEGVTKGTCRLVSVTRDEWSAAN